ncbi:hypothetical protein [Niallia sp. 03133]|uniref:hypothetical protein n=1 Tax=Niallia sp. 03133 TaxID=3458060 RepID=UPI0040447B27
MIIDKTKELCQKIYNENIQSMDNWAGYEYIGLRFEKKERTVGELCEYSKHIKNGDELDGTSAWDLSENDTYKNPSFEKSADDPYCHCYIVAGNKLGQISKVQLDANEIVIKGALVIAKIF